MYIKEDSMNLYLFLTHIIKYQFQSMQVTHGSRDGIKVRA